MLGRRDEPFPLEAVRDLLGVVRALYAAAKEARASRAELKRIVDSLTPAEPLVIAARGRVTGARASLRRRRDER